MEDYFRSIQHALETGDDTLFEVGRQQLPESLAETVEATRTEIVNALAALVRLEAELLRAKEEASGWTPIQNALPVSHTSPS
ncbi:MAG: hypothetical protein KDB68_13675 [Planctomycetes bacterium]|nr:hypothetical protein [Planctomycetota bacterium]MCA8937243.1 hypothetical protein [Planctomycetota bacterium]